MFKVKRSVVGMLDGRVRGLAAVRSRMYSRWERGCPPLRGASQPQGRSEQQKATPGQEAVWSER